jgi:uncharacterized protein
LTYKGKGRFVERDGAARRVVIEASGRDVRAAGTAAATVTAVLVPSSDAETRVEVATDLTVTGKPAQFGRGMMADVSGKLLGQFAECLADELSSSVAAPAPTPASAEPAAAVSPDANVEPIDLLQVTGVSAAARRYAPYGAAVVVVGVLVWLFVRWLRS